MSTRVGPTPELSVKMAEIALLEGQPGSLGQRARCLPEPAGVVLVDGFQGDSQVAALLDERWQSRSLSSQVSSV